MSANNGILCDFAKLASDSGLDYIASPWFVTVSKDQRIKVWNSTNGALYQHFIEPKQLSTSYKSVAIFSGLDVDNSKSAQSVGVETGYVAVGAEKGYIVIWNLQTGEISQKLGSDGDAGHAGSVNSLVFNKDGSRLYSAGADGNVIEWDMKSGKIVRNFHASDEPISKLTISADDSLILTSCSNIKLWDAMNQSLIAQYSGHVSPVNSLCFMNNTNLFMSSSIDERFVSIWNVETAAPKTKKKKAYSVTEIPFRTTPAMTLSLESSAIFVSGCGFKKGDENKATVVTVTNNNVASVWDVSEAFKNIKSTKTIALTIAKTRISLPDSQIDTNNVKAMNMFAIKSKKTKAITTEAKGHSTTDGSIVCIRFIGTNQLLVARNSIVHPQLELITYKEAESNEFITNITLGPFKKQHFGLNGTVAKRPASTQISASATSAVTLTHGQLSSKTSSSSLDSTVVVSSNNSNETLHNKRMKLLQASGELTKSLAARIQDTEKFAENLRNTRQTDTFETLLVQSIVHNDDELFERCLTLGSARSSRNAAKTLARLPSVHAVDFLKKAIMRIQKNANRSSTLLPWIRICIRTHASYLLTVSSLGTHMSVLNNIIQQRTKGVKKLLGLQGRLELILAQATRREDGAYNALSTQYVEPLHDVKVSKPRQSVDEDSDFENDDDDDDEEDFSSEDDMDIDPEMLEVADE